MTVALDGAQVRNFSEAFAASDLVAIETGADLWALRDRVAFVMWTEGRGYNWGNDGSNQSNSPGFDSHPGWPALLRRSIDRNWLDANGLPFPDKVGNNGRSTGCTQALSEDVNGSWLTMAETLRVPAMVTEFCRRVVVTDEPRYAGTLQKPGGGSERVVRELSSPIAADVLRIQQPLINEALSSNYDASQVAIAQSIARDGRFAPIEKEWSDMASEAEVEAAAGRAFANALKNPPEEFTAAVARAVGLNLTVTSKVNGNAQGLPEAIGYIDQHTYNIEKLLAVTSLVNGAKMPLADAVAYIDQHTDEVEGELEGQKVMLLDIAAVLKKLGESK